MTDIQPEAVQTMQVRVNRTFGPKLGADDFARRLLALCTSFGISATLDAAGTGVYLGEGIEGPEAEMMNDLVAVLAARFNI